MKILGVICEVREAAVWCCGDETPLCYGCDKNVHTDNKLASKHQRVALVETTLVPNCDICQEAVAFFFCREDRALLCSRCDLAVHSLNIHVSAHQRFLVPGVKAELEPIKQSPVTPSSVKNCAEKQTSSKMVQKACPGEHVQPIRNIATNGLASAEACVSEGIPERELTDIFGYTGFGKSNVDDKPADFCTPIFSIHDIDVDPDEDLVPSWRVDAYLDADDNVIQAWIADHTQGNIESSSAVDENHSLIRGWTEEPSQAWAVPELTSPLGESVELDSTKVCVPDVSYSLVLVNDNYYPRQENGSIPNRKRKL
ncbi:B-box zinc finger protein 22-like [Daucus carota subsp. sativus]|uniref:B-box zinc finger protein 22-like n=1 Tax=Daucus carota subsp. sativus TaxID=79200 RepID=UPI0007EFD258|nr:PREDICTED: B-box zinc finger protein 22-like [Daucus carota subsp. sativus]